jgi:hypothetical protein
VTHKLCDVISERVEAIRAIAWDAESAHGDEDALRAAVLRHIARGKCYNPRRCSRIALTTTGIEFARWCS